jgi:voltage-gated potassium channel
MDGEMGLSNVSRGVVLLLAVVVVGTLGFMVLEDFGFLDALYMTIITISTVGYGEVRQLETDGHVFVIILIISGLMVVGYTLTALGRAVVEGSLQRFVGRKRMMREIGAMRGHIIVCGYGRVGRTICEELQAEKGYRVVVGDAT